MNSIENLYKTIPLELINIIEPFTRKPINKDLNKMLLQEKIKILKKENKNLKNQLLDIKIRINSILNRVNSYIN